MTLSDPTLAIWPGEVMVQESGPNGIVIRAANGTEQINLCPPNDAIQMLGLANQIGAGVFSLAVMINRSPNFEDASKLITSHNPNTNVTVAQNNPCFSEGATASVVYMYNGPGVPRCFYLINQSRGMTVLCGPLWRSWKGEQGMMVKNFGAGDTLVWA